MSRSDNNNKKIDSVVEKKIEEMYEQAKLKFSLPSQSKEFYAQAFKDGMQSVLEIIGA